LRSHAVGHQPHHRAGAGADVEAAHAGLEPDAIEPLFRRPLPPQRLSAPALILTLVTGMHITVGIDLLRLCRHRADLLIRRRSRYMPHRQADLGWRNDAM